MGSGPGQGPLLACTCMTPEVSGHDQGTNALPHFSKDACPREAFPRPSLDEAPTILSDVQMLAPRVPFISTSKRKNNTLQLWSQKHQKPCKPYSNLFNSTPVVRQSLTVTPILSAPCPGLCTMGSMISVCSMNSPAPFPALLARYRNRSLQQGALVEG